MPRRLTIVQGHPDPAGNRLCHALADAYALGAAAAGHEVMRIEVARLHRRPLGPERPGRVVPVSEQRRLPRLALTLPIVGLAIVDHLVTRRPRRFISQVAISALRIAAITALAKPDVLALPPRSAV
jgi:hypothetical protein